jgi:hypothetical protein
VPLQLPPGLMISFQVVVTRPNLRTALLLHRHRVSRIKQILFANLTANYGYEFMVRSDCRVVYAQGEEFDGVYMVLAGKVLYRRQGVPVIEIPEGVIFG